MNLAPRCIGLMLVLLGLAIPSERPFAQQAFASVHVSFADSVTARPRSGSSVRAIARNDSTRETGGRRPVPRITLAAVTVSGRPGSLEVVAIPVPQAIAQSDSVRFQILPAPGARLFGRTQGILDTPKARRSSIMVTVSAPTAALAGRMRVANAEFEDAAGAAVLEVPVEMTVLDVHRIELTVIDQLVGAKRGDVATIRYRAINFGNVADSVSLAVQLPEGWKLSSGLPHAIRLGIHTAQDGVIRFWVPPGAAPGTQIVHIVATSGGAVVSAAGVRVEVDNPYIASQQQGPRLSIGTAISSMQQGPASQAYIGSLDGNIADSVVVSASAVWRANSDHATASSDLALMRLGVPTLPPSFSLRSPSLRLGVGLTGGALSDLTGAYLTGTGVSAGASIGRWTISGVDARPYQYGGLPTTNGSPGTIGEARIDRSIDSGSVFVVATHLVDPTQMRQLDATAVGAAFGSTPFGQLSSEIGYRKYEGGEGLGWAGETNHQGDDGSFSIRALHAPGGAKAFARASDEVTTSAQRHLSDWLDIGGGLWRTADASSTLGATSGLGWNVGPTFAFRTLGTNLSIQARGSSLDVTGNGGTSAAARRGSRRRPASAEARCSPMDR